MKYFIFSLFFIPMSVFGQTGYLKGGDGIQKLLTERIIESPKSFQIGELFQFESYPFELLPLLGVYDTSVISNGSIQNGAPNAFNMILWHTLIENLAKALSQECSSGNSRDNTLTVYPHIAQSLKTLCLWPLPAAKDKTIFRQFFIDVTLYDIPYSELDPWYDFLVTSGNFEQTSSKVFVETLLYTLLMNPYFLLQH